MKRALLCVFVALAVYAPLCAAPAAAEATTAIKICNYEPGDLSVAVAYRSTDDDGDQQYYSIGWYVVNYCSTINLPGSMQRDSIRFYATAAQRTKVWNPGTDGTYYCIKHEAFRYDVHSGQECPFDADVVTFYQAPQADLTYDDDGNWRMEFHTYEFGAAPTAAPAAAATPKTAPTSKPPSALAFDRGAELFNHGNFTEAISFLDQSIHLNASDAGVYAFRAQSRFDLGQYERALKDADMAVRLNPNEAWPYEFVAEAEWALGLYDSSAGDYLRAANYSKANAWYADRIASAAMVLRANGHAGEAAAALAACEKKCSGSDIVMIRYLRGEISVNAFASLAAKARFREDWYGLLGYDLALKGHTAEARSYIRRALQEREAGPWTVPPPILRRMLSGKG